MKALKQPIAKTVYNVEHWSDGFFGIDESGFVVVYPKKNEKHGAIRLHELTQKILDAGLSLPILVRFNQVLQQRLQDLHTAFGEARRRYQYENDYYPVYPIKVNQQRQVIAELLKTPVNIGLEAGSKPELMAVIGLSKKNDGLIICNGYKDREYVRLALMARKLGQEIYIILEKSSEIDLVIEEAKKLAVKPLLGIRVRLASVAGGKWQNTGGEKGKFGLSAAQVLSAVEKLRSHGFLEQLQLLHFHMGSQVANIRDIQKTIRECTRYYSELRRMGAPIQSVDVGGGLGVDYEGTRSRSFCSMNYNVQEYANNIVHALKEVCDAHELPHPRIITECGRAMVAHHAVLIANIIDRECVSDIEEMPHISDDAPRVLHDLKKAHDDGMHRPLTEIYHDLVHGLSESQTTYIHGLLSLEERAQAEQIYLSACLKIRSALQSMENPNQSQITMLNELNEKLADKFFCNFSVFQSMPDVWAISQIFPVLPLSHLDQPVSRRAILQDLTCDSDGQIKKYVDREGIESTLPLPEFDEKTPYFLGFFLVGAYQEILGDMHNLFGDTDSIHVECEGDSYALTQMSQGDSVGDVLNYVHISREELLESYTKQLDASVLSAEERAIFLEELRSGLEGYTYLEE